MKMVIGLVCGLMLMAGCGENNLVKVKIISINKRVDDGWYTRFSSVTVERLDTGERNLIMCEMLGKTGDVFSVRENFLTN